MTISNHEHGRPAETKPDSTIFTQRVKIGGILLDPKLCSKAPLTTNINLVGLAETGIEYIPVSWLGSSRVGFAVEPIIERSHASQSISIITKLVQLGNFVRSSAITAPYFLSLTCMVTDVNTRWFKSLFAEYWNLMCAVCQVDMGAPSVGDYAASHSLLLRALPHQVNPCDSYAPPQHPLSKTKPRSQTLFKSSRNWTQSFAIIFG